MSSADLRPHRDLRAYLARLEALGRLRRVAAAVDVERELACIARWAVESTCEHEQYAILFERPAGFDMPVCVNLYTTHEMAALALGVPPAQLYAHWSAALASPIPPRVVEHAAVHEQVCAGAEACLTRLPAPVWTPGRDTARYFSAAAVITVDPETGIQNVGTYRAQLHDDRHIGVFFGSRHQHGAMHYARWCARHQAMPVALVIGSAPAMNFAAAAKTAYGVDELTIAGGLLREPLDVVRCRTSDLLVPADAECVIEATIEPGAVREEGPFGEALGYMNPSAPAPVAKVTAICTRRDAIHHGYIQQLPPTDGHRVMELGVLGPLWHYLTKRLGVRGVRDLAIAPGSAAVASLAVQLDAEGARSAASIGRALAKLNFGQKFIYLVDADVDIRDAETLNWAISTRVDPVRDVTLVDGIQTWQLDPSVMRRAECDGLALDAAPYASSIAVVDATLKCRVPAISLPPAEAMHRVRAEWSRYGLPPLTPRPRLETLLWAHAAPGLEMVQPGFES